MNKELIEATRKHLETVLKTDVVEVTFFKKDGTLRVMKCTRRPDIAVPHEKTTDRVKEVNEEVCPVWDIDKGAWRSFRYDAVQQVSFTVS